MTTISNARPSPRTLRTAAAAEALLVLPATALLAASVVRLLQPPGREPARTIGLLADWGLGHATPLSATVLLIAMPAAALLIACTTLWSRWHRDEAFRQDTHALVGVARRQVTSGILVLGAVAALAILAAVVIHVITD